MRIKCPRCGLINKPEIIKCQSCGEDLSGLTELGLESPVDKKLEKPDPLSIENIKRSRRRREKEIPVEGSSRTNGELELDWREEVNRRVMEIKKEREKKQSHRIPIKEQDERIVKKRGKAVARDKDLFEEEKEQKEHRRRIEEKEEKPYKRRLQEDEEEPEVYEDEHLEEYDYDEDAELAESEEEQLEEGDEAEIETEERKEKGKQRDKTDIKKLTGKVVYDSEGEREYIPTDPEEIKQYIAEKVARRKAAKSPEGARTLAEEYGYKPKSKPKRTSVKPVDVTKSGHYEKEDLEKEYHAKELYKTYKEEKPVAPAERILADETRSLINTKRIYASVWDNIILLIITLVICRFGAGATKVTITQLLSVAWFKILIFHLVLSSFYHIYFIATNGQTIGKMLLHIRLVAKRGNQVSITRAVVHFIFSFIGAALGMIGYLWFVFSKEGKNWADYVAGTNVELY